MGRPDDTRLSFNEAAEIYDRVRPSYPADLFDALFQMQPSQPRIVEVGPGTGQATKDLLGRGASVLAIEIGPAMAAKLRSNLPSDRLSIAVGDFEITEIEAGEVDTVFSATAYHWISREAQTDRPAAILRPGGLVAIVDLIQVDSPEDAGFFAAAQSIYERYGQGHTEPRHRLVKASIRRSERCWMQIVVSTPLPSAGATGTRRTTPPTTET